MISKANRHFGLGYALTLLPVLVAVVMIPLGIPTWLWIIAIVAQLASLFFGVLLLTSGTSKMKHRWLPSQTLPEPRPDEPESH